MGYKVLLSFDQLYLSYDRSVETYVEVRDGHYEYDSLLMKAHDAYPLPSPVYSSGRWLFLKLYDSTTYVSSYEVSAKFRALPEISGERHVGCVLFRLLFCQESSQDGEEIPPNRAFSQQEFVRRY